MSATPEDPIATAQAKAKVELPRRFYEKAVAAPLAEGFAVALDGRVAKTPAGKPLAVRDRDIAEALAAEWDAQKGRIDPATMPLTRLVNAALDGVVAEMAAVKAEIVKYAGTDLLCYRAESPQELVTRQEAAWDPVLAWAREMLGARFVLAAGIVHARQPESAIGALGAALDAFEPLPLAALYTATTLTGSAILALALAHGRLSPDEAWVSAHVDEDWQMSQWGRDEIALKRRSARLAEFKAAAFVLEASRR
jgi:chaperone required for assembly of F1-ATPase